MAADTTFSHNQSITDDVFNQRSYGQSRAPSPLRLTPMEEVKEVPYDSARSANSNHNLNVQLTTRDLIDDQMG